MSFTHRVGSTADLRLRFARRAVTSRPNGVNVELTRCWRPSDRQAVGAPREDLPMSEQRGPDRSGSRSGWQWLLIIPVVVPLLTFLYNAKDPYILGFPRFYWLQLA